MALVVGSQCDRLPALSFVEDFAGKLYRALENAGWVPAVGKTHCPLLNPSTAELKATVKNAFSAANEARATLLIGFVGHGVATGHLDFYLMARDSSATEPDSDSAFHFTQFIRERLKKFTGLDGLVFLVDACQAQEGMRGAATRWADVLADNRGRMDLLVASGTGSAYDGCFTKTILTVFGEGLPTRGDALLCADLHDEIADQCTAQSQYLAYSGGDPGGGDRGLWLVTNPARSKDAVTGRPAAGLVDQLTTGLLITDQVRETLTTIAESAAERLRLAVGEPGSGKSTLLAVLVRPRLVDTLTIGDGYIKAAVFLDRFSTLESMAAEIAEQLGVTLPGFAEAAAAVRAGLTEDDLKALRLFDTAVRLPLARCKRAGLSVPIIVDGLDQPRPGAREVILEALRQLTHSAPAAELGHVRVIAGVRSGEGIDDRDELAHGYRITLAAPTVGEIAQAVSTQVGWRLSENDLARMMGDAPVGGWLVARLFAEIAQPGAALPVVGGFAQLATARMERALRAGSADAARTLSVIAAAGEGPVLPIELLAAALGGEEPLPLARIRDHVVALGALVNRGNPGTNRETLGISHLALIDAITGFTQRRDLPAAEAHQALVDAYQRWFAGSAAAGNSAGMSEAVVYWATAAPRHYLGSAHPDEALDFLSSLNTARAADNRDRWASWLPAFTTTLGPDHPVTLLTRGNLAFWHADSGDVAGAITEFEALLADYLRVLGADHPDTLTTRNNLASLRGASGDVAGAIAESEAVLADRMRVLGADHPDTLTTRGSLARWRAASGDVAGAIAEVEVLLADEVRALGADHPDTLITRNNLASLRGQSGDVAGAITEFEALLADYLRVLGADHPDTLTTRGNLAAWRADSGNVAGAIAESQALLADQVRVLGADHPDTLTTRNNLAHWRGETGDVAGAIASSQELLADRARVLGADHPDTLTARSNLAYLRAKSGDVAGAITEFEAVLADRVRVLGADHPDTLGTRHGLAYMRAQGEDVAGAITESEAVLADRVRVLGADHPDTLTTRGNLAAWRGESGDVAGAIAEFEAVLADRVRVLGANHPDTLTTRNNLASWRAQSGDLARAITESEAVLADQVRVLGADHPDTLTTRDNVAAWRGLTGDVAGAITESEAVLADRVRVLGADHPDTLTTRNNLASWLAQSGDLAGAITESEAVLADQVRVLGVDHPDTLTTRGDHASLRGMTGDVPGAIAELEGLLVDQVRVLGADHPDTLTTRNNLAQWRENASDASGAARDTGPTDA
jgi:hypothetical protein